MSQGFASTPCRTRSRARPMAILSSAEIYVASFFLVPAGRGRIPTRLVDKVAFLMRIFHSTLYIAVSCERQGRGKFKTD